MSIQELNQQVDTMSKQLKLAKTVAEVDAISTRYSDFICNTRESAYKDDSIRNMAGYFDYSAPAVLLKIRATMSAKNYYLVAKALPQSKKSFASCTSCRICATNNSNVS